MEPPEGELFLTTLTAGQEGIGQETGVRLVGCIIEFPSCRQIYARRLKSTSQHDFHPLGLLWHTGAWQAQQPQASALQGTWIDGTVRGRLSSGGWGAALGFPGLIVDSQGPS